MAFQIRDFDVVAATTGQELRFRVERGFLLAASIRNHTDSGWVNEGFGQLWLCFDDNPVNVDGILLAQGLLGRAMALGWTGRLQLHSAGSLRAVVWVGDSYTFRVSALTGES